MQEIDSTLQAIIYPPQDAMNNLSRTSGQIGRLLANRETGGLSADQREQAEASIGAAALALGALAKALGMTLEQAVATNLMRVRGQRSGGLLMAQTAQRRTKEIHDAR